MKPRSWTLAIGSVTLEAACTGLSFNEKGPEPIRASNLGYQQCRAEDNAAEYILFARLRQGVRSYGAGTADTLNEGIQCRRLQSFILRRTKPAKARRTSPRA